MILRSLIHCSNLSKMFEGTGISNDYCSPGLFVQKKTRFGLLFRYKSQISKYVADSIIRNIGYMDFMHITPN